MFFFRRIRQGDSVSYSIFKLIGALIAKSLKCRAATLLILLYDIRRARYQPIDNCIFCVCFETDTVVSEWTISGPKQLKGLNRSNRSNVIKTCSRIFTRSTGAMNVFAIVADTPPAIKSFANRKGSCFKLLAVIFSLLICDSNYTFWHGISKNESMLKSTALLYLNGQGSEWGIIACGTCVLEVETVILFLCSFYYQLQLILCHFSAWQEFESKRSKHRNADS